MLKFINMAGDVVVELHPDTVSGSNSLVGEFTERLSKILNFSSFGIKLVSSGNVLADQQSWNELGKPQEIQLVTLPLVTHCERDLLAAVRREDVCKVEKILQKPHDAACTYPDGTPLLVEASRKGNHEIVKLLHRALADINSTGRNGRTALYEAIAAYDLARGHFEVVHFLLDAGANTDQPDWLGNTPLHAAVSGGYNIEVVRLLLKASADMDRANSQGVTPLRAAARWGHAEDVAALLEAGSNPNKADASRGTPLLAAVLRGNACMVRLLVEKRAEAREGCLGRMLLLWKSRKACRWTRAPSTRLRCSPPSTRATWRLRAALPKRRLTCGGPAPMA